MIFVSPGEVYSEEVEPICDLGPEGLGLWAAASLTDPIPGDAVLLGIAAAGSGAACAARDEFVEHYPDADGIKVKRPEDQSDDIVVTPTYDPPWWLPPVA